MKKKTLIICLLFVLIAIIIFAATRPEKKSEPNTGNPNTVAVQLNEDTPIPKPEYKEAVPKAITDMIKHNEPQAEGSQAIEIRKESMSPSQTATGVPKLRYLIDIPQLRRTFAVEIEGGATNEYSTLYVVCPQENELKYEVKTCRNQE